MNVADYNDVFEPAESGKIIRQRVTELPDSGFRRTTTRRVTDVATGAVRMVETTEEIPSYYSLAYQQRIPCPECIPSPFDMSDPIAAYTDGEIPLAERTVEEYPSNPEDAPLPPTPHALNWFESLPMEEKRTALFILREMHRHPESTMQQLSVNTREGKLSAATLQRYKKLLVKHGMVRRVGNRLNGRWQILQGQSEMFSGTYYLVRPWEYESGMNGIGDGDLYPRRTRGRYTKYRF